MFYHMNLAAKETHEYNGNKFELVVYHVEENSHLRGYISSCGFSGRIVEMSDETARYCGRGDRPGLPPGCRRVGGIPEKQFQLGTAGADGT